MTGLDIGLSLIAGVGGVITTYVGLTVRPLEKNDEALADRIKGMHDDIKDDREKFERRLSDIERSYVSRIELERTINSIADRMDRGTARIEAGVKDLGVKVDHLSDRVSKVEAA